MAFMNIERQIKSSEEIFLQVTMVLFLSRIWKALVDIIIILHWLIRA